ncbi:MAG: hypothetical protein JSS83_08315 [Cyanobacteria bacterium SZAS LIN-3]|nr:hypothetical protein [Cyanobacteria bacterium SZAS LIN-3]
MIVMAALTSTRRLLLLQSAIVVVLFAYFAQWGGCLSEPSTDPKSLSAEFTLDDSRTYVTLRLKNCSSSRVCIYQIPASAHYLPFGLVIRVEDSRFGFLIDSMPHESGYSSADCRKSGIWTADDFEKTTLLPGQVISTKVRIADVIGYSYRGWRRQPKDIRKFKVQLKTRVHITRDLGVSFERESPKYEYDDPRIFPVHAFEPDYQRQVCGFAEGSNRAEVAAAAVKDARARFETKYPGLKIGRCVPEVIGPEDGLYSCNLIVVSDEDERATTRK